MIQREGLRFRRRRCQDSERGVKIWKDVSGLKYSESDSDVDHSIPSESSGLSTDRLISES